MLKVGGKDLVMVDKSWKVDDGKAVNIFEFLSIHQRLLFDHECDDVHALNRVYKIIYLLITYGGKDAILQKNTYGGSILHNFPYFGHTRFIDLVERRADRGVAEIALDQRPGLLGIKVTGQDEHGELVCGDDFERMHVLLGDAPTLADASDGDLAACATIEPMLPSPAMASVRPTSRSTPGRHGGCAASTAGGVELDPAVGDVVGHVAAPAADLVASYRGRRGRRATRCATLVHGEQ